MNGPRPAGHGVNARIAGCLGGCASSIGAVVVVIVGFAFAAKDTIANYAPGVFEKAGLGFLAAPPQAVDPIKTTAWYDAELHWQRSPLNKDRIEYELRINPKKKLVVKEATITVYSPTEAGLQGDLLGDRGFGFDTAKIGREELVARTPWVKTGSLRADPLGRPTVDTFRLVVATVTFEHPDDPKGTKPDKTEKYVLELKSEESSFE